ncbi:MAG: N-acetylmuramoyl-L-alanine amidase [Desulfotomaculum sp.]|nr:N-acetylmuramoyl-L-alanine amidase [Desulfotomaculum sp.]
MRIVIDPGHGGKDPGAVANGLTEKRLTWDIANLVKQKLANVDADVIIIQPSAKNPNSTAKDEVNLPPQEANRLGADFFLSIHINAGGGTGFESFVYSKGSKADRIRNKLHHQIMQYLKKYNLPDRGKKYSQWLGVLRMTKMPAVLIECGFIDHPNDARLLADPKFINGLANEIAYGLIVALGLKTKGGK